MFSQTVEYALRAMVQLASQAPEACTTQQIAKKTKVPAAYLAKVLQSMRRAGLINSRRGVGGGVSLARPAKKISLLDVIDAVEPLERSGGKSAAGTLGPLQRKLEEALTLIRKTFADASLGDMLDGGRKKAAGAPKRRRKKKAKRPAARG
jgi:Rrf2 family protein